MKKHTALLTLAALAMLPFASCSKEAPVENEENLIKFTADIQSAATPAYGEITTKALTSDGCQIQLGVTRGDFPDAMPETKIARHLTKDDISRIQIACHNSTGYEFTDGIYNLKGQNWIGTKHYFHGDPNKTLTFYACSALQGDGSVAAPTMNTSAATPKITYTVPADSLKQLDLICAKKVASNKASEDITLQFKHMLAGIRFKDETAGSGYIIQYIKICGVYTKGTYDLATEIPTDEHIFWTDLQIKSDFNVAPRIVNGKKTFTTPEGSIEYLMIPQATYNSYIEIGYNTKEGGLLLVARYNLASVGWPAGCTMTYSIFTE